MTDPKVLLQAEEARAKAWYVAHRTTIIVGVVCFLLGLILPHIL